jgi:hypothetical protein
MGNIINIYRLTVLIDLDDIDSHTSSPLSASSCVQLSVLKKRTHDLPILETADGYNMPFIISAFMSLNMAR